MKSAKILERLVIPLILVSVGFMLGAFVTNISGMLFLGLGLGYALGYAIADKEWYT